MKRFVKMGIVVVVLGLMLMVAGCTVNPPTPFDGTWSGLGGLIGYTFRSDLTFNALALGITGTGGTFAYTDTLLTLTYSDNTVDEEDYSFSANGLQLTLTPHGGGVGLIFDKQ